MTTVRIDETTDLEVPEEYGPEETQRYIRQFQTWREQHKANPPELPTPTEYDYHDVDPSKQDPWGTWIDKSIRSTLRGGVTGLATMGDIVRNAAINDWRYLTNTGIQRDETGKPVADVYEQGTPITDYLEQNFLAKPYEGSGYESAEELGAIAAPAIVESLATEGLGARRYIGPNAVRPTVSVINNPLTRTAARATRDVGAGVVGGEVGGTVAAQAFGEENRDLGRLFGGALTAGIAPTLATKAASKMLTKPESLGNLRTIDRVNANLPPEQQIPPSIGLVGNKAAGTLEDVTGRTIFSQDATRARAKQFEGMEHGVQSTLEEARGAPSTGQITPETIGREGDVAISAAQQRATNRIAQIQSDLEAKVGSTSPVGLHNTVRELDDIILRPKEYDTGTIQQARDLRATILANMQRPQGAGRKRSRVSQGTAGYGAVKDVRSKLGRAVDRNQQPLSKAVQERGYTGLTEDMEEAAAMQGVAPEDFRATQAETQGLYQERGALEELTGKTEGATHTKTVGGKGTSVKQLDPLLKHAPDETLKMLVDDLELRLRKGSAGGPIRSDLFDPTALLQWRNMSPERKALIAKNNPEIIGRMDDLADVANMENVRGGRRTRPGTTGSTMGATLNYAIPAAVGGLAKSLAAGVATAGIPKLVGKVMSSPAFTRAVVDPQSSLANVFGRAVAGGAAAANIRETEMERRRREEIDARMKATMGGGQ